MAVPRANIYPHGTPGQFTLRQILQIILHHLSYLHKISATLKSRSCDCGKRNNTTISMTDSSRARSHPVTKHSIYKIEKEAWIHLAQALCSKAQQHVTIKGTGVERQYYLLPSPPWQYVVWLKFRAHVVGLPRRWLALAFSIGSSSPYSASG